jgi:hypothetical protein
MADVIDLGDDVVIVRPVISLDGRCPILKGRRLFIEGTRKDALFAAGFLLAIQRKRDEDLSIEAAHAT